MGPLNGPVHNMNSCNVVLAQAKATKLTWSTASGSRAGHVRLQSVKKCLAKGEDLNALVTNEVKEVMKKNKFLNAKAANYFGSEDEQENFKFEDLKIG